jgi:hypothetical protein
MNSKSNTIITSLVWVKKGFCKAIPIEYQEEDEKLIEVKKIEDKLKKLLIINLERVNLLVKKRSRKLLLK